MELLVCCLLVLVLILFYRSEAHLNNIANVKNIRDSRMNSESLHYANREQMILQCKYAEK